MKLTVLVENTACRDGIGCAHGLSLYIETKKHRILFDAGPDGELLKKNAVALGVDLKSIDTALLSHGHYDHSGGMAAFLEENSHAGLFLHRMAPCGHWATENTGFRYIGLSPELMEKYAARMTFVDDALELDEELLLFSDIKTADFLSGSNTSLYEELADGSYACDRFLHEMNLLICQDDSISLVAGCAHRGIVNILRRAEELCGRVPDHVFSGFHLTNPGLKKDEPAEHVQNIGRELAGYDSHFYTGHCTGLNPFAQLKEILSGRLDYLSSGSSFIV